MAKAKDFFEFAKKNNAEMMDLEIRGYAGKLATLQFPNRCD